MEASEMSTEPNAIWLDESALRDYFVGGWMPEQDAAIQWINAADDYALGRLGEMVLTTDAVWEAITEAILLGVSVLRDEGDGDDEQD